MKRRIILEAIKIVRNPPAELVQKDMPQLYHPNRDRQLTQLVARNGRLSQGKIQLVYPGES
ncbi:hypothetical protein OIU84_000081 [Salix udensis]|uniref:Uncharacterized protein n=1 Tax=Salix udensis TaxID=889485 RepID=A0AAD6PLX6_9ROSI|nr:hypothetical protein OIU84_000081 [Salix udensis]